MSYLSSYTYSFRFNAVGIHEAVLSVSSIILPPLVGFLSSATGELRLPYWLCAGLLGATVVVQEVFYHSFWAVYHRRSAHEKAIELAKLSPSLTPRLSSEVEVVTVTSAPSSASSTSTTTVTATAAALSSRDHEPTIVAMPRYSIS
jgi:hypothetical protein